MYQPYKFVVIASLAASLIVVAACTKKAQLDAVEVPQVVQNAFELAYPGARSVDWSMEGDQYEVDFRDGGFDKEVVYDKNGLAVVVETEISFLALPQITQDYIGTHYPDRKIEDVERVEGTNGRFYVVELSGDDAEIELIFDEKGEFLRVDSEEKDEDEDEESENK